MVDPVTPPADADKGKTTPPVPNGGDGQGGKTVEPLNLPEKFKGKSPDEIAKAYIELESKMGEQSKTVEEANKLKEQTDTLLRAIWADPDLYRKVEEGVKKFVGGGKLPEDPNKNPLDKGNEEVDKPNPQLNELRVAEESRVLNEFFSKYGYTTLDEKTRKEAYTRLSLGLADMVDPGGNRPIKEILSTIPLTKLPRYLENAHFLVNKDSILANARKPASFDQRSNDSATIGSFSASSGQPRQTVELTNHEREVAQKLGISEDKYAKKKAEIEADNKRFG